MDLQFPKFHDGVVRCRLSKCIRVDAVKEDELRAFLERRSNWRRPSRLGVGTLPPIATPGGAPPWSADAAGWQAPLSARPPLPGAQSPERSPSPSGRPRSQSPTGRPVAKAFRGDDSQAPPMATWSFMKHLPGGPALQAVLAREAALPRRGAGGAESKRVHQVLHSDIAAILWFRGGAAIADPSGSTAGAPSALDIAEWVPPLTEARWRKLLKMSDRSQKESKGNPNSNLATKLADRLARTLSTRLEWFNVTPLEPPHINCRSFLQLRPNASLESTLPSSHHQHQPSRTERSARWLGALPVLQGFEEAVGDLSRQWKFELDIERLELVAKAVERAESLRLCGGAEALDDRLRAHPRAGAATAATEAAAAAAAAAEDGADGANDDCTSDEGRRSADSRGGGARGGARRVAPCLAMAQFAQRGKNGIDPDWLLTTLSEASGDLGPEVLGLELGNGVRLLSQLAEAVGGLDPAEATTEADAVTGFLPMPMFTDNSWERFCRSYQPLALRPTYAPAKKTRRLRSSLAAEISAAEAAIDDQEAAAAAATPAAGAPQPGAFGMPPDGPPGDGGAPGDNGDESDSGFSDVSSKEVLPPAEAPPVAGDEEPDVHSPVTPASRSRALPGNLGRAPPPASTPVPGAISPVSCAKSPGPGHELTGPVYCPLVPVLGGALGEQDVEPKQLFQEGLESLLHFYVGRGAMLRGPVVSRAVAACTPLVLEAVLQRTAASRNLSCADVVGDVLWSLCGWDTPVGRRLMRRLCRAFDRFAGSHELSRASFIKIAVEAGWATARDHANRYSRFWDIYQRAIDDYPDDRAADFIDFMYMLEVVAEEVMRPRLVAKLQSAEPAASPTAAGAGGGGGGRAAGEERYMPTWAVIEATCAPLVGTVNAAAAGASIVEEATAALAQEQGQEQEQGGSRSASPRSPRRSPRSPRSGRSARRVGGSRQAMSRSDSGSSSASSAFQ